MVVKMTIFFYKIILICSKQVAYLQYIIEINIEFFNLMIYLYV